MSKMDEFVETMAKAMELSTQMADEGITGIRFRLTYSGTPLATSVIKHKIESIEMEGLTHNKAV